MSTLKLAIPSKGRLMESTVAWFARSGVKIDTPLDKREYVAQILGMPKIEVVLISASEIPKKLSTGQIDLGVTGQDLIRETVPVWEEIICELKQLEFGKANLVLAVPKFWVDVDSIDDFDAVAINFRRKNGFRLRIATKYQNTMRSYLRRMGVADYQLVDSQGATEGTVKNNIAEAIADITSSGKTLAANHLKVVGREPVLSSQAVLYLSKGAEWSPNKMKLLEDFGNRIDLNRSQLFNLTNSKS